jgi:uncharacterized protein
VTAAIKLVLDTNIVLDWLVFDNEFMNALRQGVRDRRVVVLTHQPAIDELRRVLSYSALKLDAARQGELLAEYRASTQLAAMPMEFAADHLMLPTGFPSCRDSDDQHFLALAYHSKADALISRDKAVLKLAKRTPKFGVRILNVPQMIEMLP